jgi:hypothetical protein
MTTVYVPAEATGTDTKLYAGATCVPTAGPHVHGGGDELGSISNGSEEVQLFVFCPVVRDVSRGQEIGVEKVTIWVVDQHPDDENDQGIFDLDNVFCSFRSRDNPRVSLNAVDTATAASKGASPDVQELEIFNRISASRGYYVLQCNIPTAVEGRASSIIAYEVVERQ